MAWQAIIGLEVHVQLRTESKIFSGAPTRYGAAPNTQACAIDLGMPGVLPTVNAAAIRAAIKFGLAINAQIAQRTVFARKNYFYPDLPKGYQISQYDEPIVREGHLSIPLQPTGSKQIRICRAHLEEDAGKSLHDVCAGFTAIDLNRAGTPLLEIVTAPELTSSAEAVAYLKQLHALVRYLDISDGNLQEGSFRCDANVSVRPANSQQLGIRSEIKNVNSFRFVEQAIDYEIDRQIDRLERGLTIVQETRLYDPEKQQTRSMRGKEEANDYRYFPDPDLLPMTLSDALIAEIRQCLPELPQAKLLRFQQAYGLPLADAEILVSQKALADYFEAVLRESQANAKTVANWLLTELMAALNKHHLTIEENPITVAAFAQLLTRLQDNTLSGKMAKTVFQALWDGEGTVDEIITARGLQQITDNEALTQLIAEVLQAHPEQVAAYRDGKEKLFGFFVGRIMQATQGKANPQQVNQLLLEKLKGAS